MIIVNINLNNFNYNFRIMFIKTINNNNNNVRENLFTKIIIKIINDYFIKIIKIINNDLKFIKIIKKTLVFHC